MALKMTSWNLGGCPAALNAVFNRNIMLRKSDQRLTCGRTYLSDHWERRFYGFATHQIIRASARIEAEGLNGRSEYFLLALTRQTIGMIDDLLITPRPSRSRRLELLFTGRTLQHLRINRLVLTESPNLFLVAF